MIFKSRELNTHTSLRIRNDDELVQAEIAVSVESEAVRQCGTANAKIYADRGSGQTCVQ